MTNDALWLALDQGGHASRALVFDQQGKQVAQAYAAISTQRIDNDRVEHDANEIVDSLRLVIDEVTQTLGADAARVHAAGLATQRSSVVCWNRRTGQPLSPVLSWQDRRNVELVSQLISHRDAIQQITGLVLSPHYGASKIRWCLDHLDAVKTAQDQGDLCCGPLASYLLFSLLNNRPCLVDPANASRTQLWSPATGDWSEDLLYWFGIPKVVLPKPVSTVFNYGLLPFADRTIPLRVCTGDQAAVPFANGALKSNTLYINLGTGAFILAPIDQPIPQAAPLLSSVLRSDNQSITYALEGTVNGAGSALSWWQEQTIVDVWESLSALQRSTVENNSPPLFVNAIGGIASPYWLATQESKFIDNASSDAQHHLIAIIESIAFLINANIELMRAKLPILDTIQVGGGLSACPYLSECLADLCGLSVVRVSERELTGRGLAYLVAGRPQSWSPVHVKQIISPTKNPNLLSRQAKWRSQMQVLA
jgi:glycerol kinase